MGMAIHSEETMVGEVEHTHGISTIGLFFFSETKTMLAQAIKIYELLVIGLRQ